MSVIVLVNLLPFLGLAVFGWGVVELLVVYWVEAVIAALVGIAKTFPARLIAVPLADPRSEPLLKVRHGTVSFGSGRFTGYARNVPTVGTQLALVAFFAVPPMLALFVPSSPLSYSSQEAAATVAIVAGLLVVTHVVTARTYFAEERYRRTLARTASGAGFVALMGVFALVVMLWLGHSSSGDQLLHVWPSVLSYVFVGGKVGAELVFRCRDRDRFERVDENVDPFDVRANMTDVLLLRKPGMKVAELPRVARPNSSPRTTVKPSRSSIVRASPIIGLVRSRDGVMTLFLFAFTVLLLVEGVHPVLPLVTSSIALVFAASPALLYTLPRHATLEYEFYDDRLVCYDRWLEEPVWNLPYDDVESVSVEHGITARVGGYATVVLETSDDVSARLAYLREYDDVADRLERAVRVEIR